MKVFVLGMVLVLGMQLWGAGGVQMRGTPGEELKDIKKLAKTSQDEELEKLGVRICAAYSMAGNKIADNVKKRILAYMKKHEGISNPSVAQIITFLNQNKNKILCENGTKSYMMVAFDSAAFKQLFEKLLLGEFVTEDDKVVNLNAVAHAGENGEPMTVLDYMDVQLADKTHSKDYLSEVRAFRNMFVDELGAKHFSELPESEKAKYR